MTNRTVIVYIVVNPSVRFDFIPYAVQLRNITGRREGNTHNIMAQALVT